MRALTLIQPWATLIVHHGKDIENRSWATNHRGPLLIHAGKKIDGRGFELAWELGIDLPADLPAGGIIGQVELIGCIRDSPSRWAMDGYWHWQLSRAQPIPFQPMKGQMGLFTVSVEGEPAPAQSALF